MTSLANSTQNQLGGGRGTAVYMAPELLDSTRPAEFSADVYSFGVLLNELVCEEQPFADQLQPVRGRGDFAFALHAKEGNRPTVHFTDRAFCDLLQKCWNSEAALRPKISDIRESLAAASFGIPNWERFINHN